MIRPGNRAIKRRSEGTIEFDNRVATAKGVLFEDTTPPNQTVAQMPDAQDP